MTFRLTRARTSVSVEFALALGRALAVKLGRMLLPPCTLLSFRSTPFSLFRLLRMPFRRRSVFRRAFPLVFGLVMLLRCRHGVGFCFLAVSGDLAAKPLALTFALPAALGRSSGCEQHQREHDQDGDYDGDYGNR